MAAESVNGIVISYTDYRDNDRMLTLFTVERGRIDCKARNCRKPTAPLLACAQPFVYGEYTLFFSNDRATVNNCDIKESFYALREDPDRFMIASAVVRLCLFGQYYTSRMVLRADDKRCLVEAVSTLAASCSPAGRPAKTLEGCEEEGRGGYVRAV